MSTSYHDVLPTMMLLYKYLIMATIFVASKWTDAPQKGKEEVCGIDFGKSDFSRFILIMPLKIVFRIILASVVTLLTFLLA
jgi:hypothetical protein